MLKIEYVGNKPLISHNGISFEGKTDKYEFIEPLAHILKMLLNMQNEQETERISPKNIMNNEEILKIVRKAIPDIEKRVQTDIEKYKKNLSLEEKKIEEKNSLSQTEKEVLKKNFDFMKNYRIQRAINKIIYEEMINKCLKLIEEKKVQNIKAPFSATFLHVMKSLQQAIENEKKPGEVKLSIKLNKTSPYIMLKIN